MVRVVEVLPRGLSNNCKTWGKIHLNAETGPCYNVTMASIICFMVGIRDARDMGICTYRVQKCKWWRQNMETLFWPFLIGIYWSSVNQCEAFMFSLLLASTSYEKNSRVDGDLRRHGEMNAAKLTRNEIFSNERKKKGICFVLPDLHHVVGLFIQLLLGDVRLPVSVYRPNKLP